MNNAISMIFQSSPVAATDANAAEVTGGTANRDSLPSPVRITHQRSD
ncbi:hypothetical protein U9R62_07845 [Cylindrospermopsis raciborskii DSH]